MRLMKRLTFLLSGEHPKIPSSEVIASIEAEECDYEVVESLDQVLTVDTHANPLRLASRLGMAHWVGENFGISSPEYLMDSLGSSDLLDFLPQSGDIAVRVKRIKRYLPEINELKLAERVADEILEEYDYDINLENQENEIFILLTEGKIVSTIVRAKIDRSAFVERKPPKRAAVHPGTMQPNFARALVNLARTPRNGTFLDPFCGVGGILLEAGLLGAIPVGIDIDSELIEGAEENLQVSGINEFELRTGDARDLEIEKVDAIATDPPYGRQASTGGMELKDLYRDALPVLADSLKSGGYFCITAPSGLNLKKMAKNIPLEPIEKYQQRVHKSLIRKIYVFRRE